MGTKEHLAEGAGGNVCSRGFMQKLIQNRVSEQVTENRGLSAKQYTQTTRQNKNKS